ncbi:MAG TPA: ATP synthase F1 subunit epsilon [Lachnospiraceae bacterium]|nr:ATP synthase F1 subunit epsilon [Lachnospiraceae bacterium]
MAKKLTLRIVTPSRVMYEGEVGMVLLRTKSGDVGILPEHQPMVTVLDYGVMKLYDDGNEIKRAAVLGGYAEVGDSIVSVLTDAAEWAEEIDEARAKHAKEIAERRLASQNENIDIMRAELALKRALVRLNVNNL